MGRLVSTLIVAVLYAVPSPGFATTTAYDGSYAITATTDEGACPRTADGTVTVVDGHISDLSEADVSANGLVDNTGTVSFVFARGAQVAHAAGHLRGRSGTGTWSSNTALCGGRWRAVRR